MYAFTAIRLLLWVSVLLWAGSVGGQTPVSELAQKLQSEDPEVRLDALREFANRNPERAGTNALPLLTTALADPDARIRAAATSILYYIATVWKGVKLSGAPPTLDPSTYPPLKEALLRAIEDPDEQVRGKSEGAPLRALVEGFGPSPEITAVLLDRLKVETSPHVRRNVVLALTIGADSWSQPVLSALAKALEDQATMEPAANFFATLNPPPDLVLPFLLKAFEATVREPYLESSVLRAIEAFGARAVPALPTLTQRLQQTPDPEVRAHVERVIAAIRLGKTRVHEDYVLVPNLRQTALDLVLGASSPLPIRIMFDRGIERQVDPIGDGVTFESANPKIATIDRSGRVTAVGVGQTVMIAHVDKARRANKERDRLEIPVRVKARS